MDEKHALFGGLYRQFMPNRRDRAFDGNVKIQVARHVGTLVSRYGAPLDLDNGAVFSELFGRIAASRDTATHVEAYKKARDSTSTSAAEADPSSSLLVPQDCGWVDRPTNVAARIFCDCCDSATSRWFHT